MDVFIPAFLQQHILQFGAEGAHWLAHLPLRIVELEQEWDFRVGPAFDHGGAVSWVAPVERSDKSSDYVAQWWDDLPRITATAAYEGDIVAEVVARGRELAAS